MVINIPVTQDFIDQRDERAGMYNPRGRSEFQLKKDIECEIYEYHMINIGEWDDDERWQVDGVCPDLGNVDVKFITKWYNISQYKMLYLLRQRDITEHFVFCEWTDRPKRLLQAGDVVGIRCLGHVPYWTLIDGIQPSGFAGSDGRKGYYADARRLLRAT